MKTSRRDILKGMGGLVVTPLEVIGKMVDEEDFEPIPALDFGESELIASICRDSFWDFVQEFWGEIIDEPLIPNWHMEYLCRELQKVAERVFKREPKQYDLLINIAPGSSKSTIVSVMFPMWCWIREGWVQTICGSYGHELSLDLASKSRIVLQSEKFKNCFPKLKLRLDQNTKTYFQNTDGGWRYATSTGGAVTGKHGHLIIIDDPIDPQGALSEAELKGANDWLTDTIPKRKVSQKNSVMIMIMQRLSLDDPSALWLEWAEKGLPLRHVCIPAELTKESCPFVKPKNLKRFYQDGLMDPIRLSRESLRAQELLSNRSYSGQYNQMPMPPGGGMFHIGKILVEESIDYSDKSWRLVRYWDKAATHDGGCYTVGVLMGRKGDVYWVLDVVRGQWDASEREQIIKQTAQMDSKRVIIGVEREPGSGGKESAQATIRNLSGFRVYADLPTGSKVIRADPYASQVNGENVKMKRAAWNRDYLDELAMFPPISAKYQDQVDASSGAFARLAKKRTKIGAF